MTWTRLSDTFADRPDVMRLSRNARLLHIEALIYCNRQLTNGRTPRNMLRRLSDSDTLADDVTELLAVGLWQEDDLGNYLIDWQDQEAAADVRARQEYRAQTQHRYRDRKSRHSRGDHSECDPRYCKQSTKSVTSNATDNESSHVSSKKTPSRPVPSRPLGRDQGQEGEGSTSSARATLARPPSEEDDLDCPHLRNGLGWHEENGYFNCELCYRYITEPWPDCNDADLLLVEEVAAKVRANPACFTDRMRDAIDAEDPAGWTLAHDLANVVYEQHGRSDRGLRQEIAFYTALETDIYHRINPDLVQRLEREIAS